MPFISKVKTIYCQTMGENALFTQIYDQLKNKATLINFACLKNISLFHFIPFHSPKISIPDGFICRNASFNHGLSII